MRAGAGMPASASSSAGSPPAWCARRISAICWRIRKTGLRASSGSWKIIAICAPRTDSRPPSSSASRSRPRNSTWPPTRYRAGGSSLRRASARVVLPEPESPERPAVLPSGMSNETPRKMLWWGSRSMRRSRTSSSGSGGIVLFSGVFRGVRGVLWLHAEVAPFGVAGTFDALAGHAGNQVHVSVEVEILARREIDKAGIETCHGEGFGNTPAELRDSVPHHTLLLNVQVVEGGDVTARGNYQVAGCEWVRVWHGDHKLREHPGVLRCYRAIRT